VLAANLQGFVQTQVVAVVTPPAQPYTPWPNPPPGAHSFLVDTNRLEQYNGTAWGPVRVAALTTTGDVLGTGALTLRSFAGAIDLAPQSARINSYGRYNALVAASGQAWSDKQLVISAGPMAAGTLNGIGFESSGLGAIILQAYTSSQSTVGFHVVNGSNSGYCSLTASNLTVPSERRLKRNVAPLAVDGGALAVVEALEPVTYTLPPPPPTEYPEGMEPPDVPATLEVAEPGPAVGFVAEDVAAAGAPAGVVNAAMGDVPMTLDLMGMVALLTAAVQELTARVATLEGAG
jgi:hypothetical protein